jgi:hypothetical protein
MRPRVLLDYQYSRETTIFFFHTHAPNSPGDFTSIILVSPRLLYTLSEFAKRVVPEDFVY